MSKEQELLHSHNYYDVEEELTEEAELLSLEDFYEIIRDCESSVDGKKNRFNTFKEDEHAAWRFKKGASVKPCTNCYAGKEYTIPSEGWRRCQRCSAENQKIRQFQLIEHEIEEVLIQQVERHDEVLTAVLNAETTNHIDGHIGPGSLDEQEIDEVFMQRFEEHNEILIAGDGEDEKELEEKEEDKAEEGEQSLPRLWSEEDNNVPLSLADELLSVDPLTFTPLQQSPLFREVEEVQQAPPCANLCTANSIPSPYSNDDDDLYWHVPSVGRRRGSRNKEHKNWTRKKKGSHK